MWHVFREQVAFEATEPLTESIGRGLGGGVVKLYQGEQGGELGKRNRHLRGANYSTKTSKTRQNTEVGGRGCVVLITSRGTEGQDAVDDAGVTEGDGYGRKRK